MLDGHAEILARLDAECDRHRVELRALLADTPKVHDDKEDVLPPPHPKTMSPPPTAPTTLPTTLPGAVSPLSSADPAKVDRIHVHSCPAIINHSETSSKSMGAKPRHASSGSLARQSTSSRTIRVPASKPGMHAHGKTSLPRRSETKARMLYNMLDKLPLSDRLSYEAGIFILVSLNAAFVGFETQMAFSDKGFGSSELSLAVGCTFVAVFAIDLSFRAYQSGLKHFLTGDDRVFNWFDVFVVSATFLDQVVRVAYSDDNSPRFLSSLRVFRLLRFARAAYLFRALMVFKHFRVLMSTICMLTSALVWTLSFLAVVVYIWAIVFTDGATRHCMEGGDSPDFPEVCYYFGGLGRSMLSLYMSIFGGVPWADVLRSLYILDAIYPIMFGLFLSFGIIIIILNSLTALSVGIYGDAAAELYREAEYLNHKDETEKQKLRVLLEKVFREADVNETGDISREEFQYVLEEPQVKALFLRFEVHDPEAVFDILDSDGSGVLSLDEFVNNFNKLKGGARALDVMKLQKGQCLIEKKLDEALGVTDSIYAASLPVGETPRKMDDMDDFDFNDMYSHKEVLRIPNAEDRAVTLKELSHIRRVIEESHSRWTHPETGSPLQPGEVNLYLFCDYHILPSTVPNGVYLTGLDIDGCSPDMLLIQPHSIGGKKMVPAEGKVLEVLDDGRVHVQLTKGKFWDSGDNVQVFDQDEALVGSVRMVESEGAVSFKERIAARPSKPLWYCCHWWGESVLDFVACCEAHAELRDIPHRTGQEASYWVCGYANNQHLLTEDITEDPTDSSFYRAMSNATGVLLVLDPHAQPFRRIWCSFELYRTISDEDKQLDIMTVCRGENQEWKAQLIADGLLPGESRSDKVVRERRFPRELLFEGIHRALEDGECSVQRDKDTILASMARDTPEHEGNLTERREASLRRANACLNSTFAIAAWPSTLEEEEDVCQCSNEHGTVSLPKILSNDRWRQRLELSLAHIDCVNNNSLKDVAIGLPETLQELQLSFQGCKRVSDQGLMHIVKGLPQGLQSLKLSLFGCVDITDRSGLQLVQQLPKTLKVLHLDFGMCRHISQSFLLGLDEHLPRSVSTLTVILKGTELDITVRGVKKLHDLARHLCAKDSDKHALTKLSGIFRFAKAGHAPLEGAAVVPSDQVQLRSVSQSTINSQRSLSAIKPLAKVNLPGCPDP